jgi:hypothetical protein
MHSLFWAAAVIVSAWETATVGLPLALTAASLLPTVFLLGLAILARVAEGPAHRRLALVGIAGMLSLPAISVLAHEYGGVVGSFLFDHVAGPVATVVCVVLIAAADLVVQRRSALPYLLPTLAVALPFLVAVADLWTGHLAWFSLPGWLAIEVLLGSGALAVLVLVAVVTRRLWLRVVTVYTLELAALAPDCVAASSGDDRGGAPSVASLVHRRLPGRRADRVHPKGRPPGGGRPRGRPRYRRALIGPSAK